MLKSVYLLGVFRLYSGFFPCYTAKKKAAIMVEGSDNMRNLKFAILGLVNREPMTGYDIKKAFEDRALTNFWHAEHSQIYPELAKLVKEGSLEVSTVIQGQKMEKKLYTITESGRAEFNNWLSDDVEIERTYKDIFRLRTFFSDSLEQEQFLELLKSQRKQHIARRDYLAHIKETVFQEIPAIGTPLLGDYMVLDGAVSRETDYVKWLERCIKIYKQ